MSTRRPAKFQLSETQKQNIKTLINDLKSSVDAPPSQTGIAELKADFKAAFSDRTLTRSEFRTLANDVIEIAESAGVNATEARTILYDLQNIAEASRLPRTNDTLTGTTQSDILWGGLGQDSLNGAGSDDAGANEIDYLCGGSGKDTFLVGDASRTFYDDGKPLTLGLNDYAIILDFNLEQDKVQLHGSASEYTLDAVPAEFGVTGTAIYHTDGQQPGSRELVGVMLGSTLSDFNAGFSFVV